MKSKSLAVKILLLMIIATVTFSSCSKKTCPAYSQVNQAGLLNKA
ncbi:MAG: hypothetical protein AB7S54_01335 [Bacteroidales bacterium]